MNLITLEYMVQIDCLDQSKKVFDRHFWAVKANLLHDYDTIAQFRTLCCNWKSSKYLELDINHLVTDYTHNLSL